MTQNQFAITNYVQDGKVHRYETRGITSHHELLRSQYPAETIIGKIDVVGVIGGFGMRIADEVIANDGWREWKRQRDEEVKARRLKWSLEQKAKRAHAAKLAGK